MSLKDPANQARFRAAAAIAESYPCILCGESRVERVGVFVPRDDDELFEHPQGAKTCFGYALCLECSTLDDKHKRVLEALLASWGRRSDD